MNKFDIYDVGVLYDSAEKLSDTGNSQGEYPSALSDSIYMSHSDALVSSVNQFGEVDLDYIASVSGLPVPEVLEALRGKGIWQDPEVYDQTQDEKTGWMLSDQYFSGNLIRKYHAAIKLNKKYGIFTDNIRELEKHLPSMPSMDQIHIALGSPWVPAVYYARFIKDLLDPYFTPEVSYISYLGKWRIRAEIATSSIRNNYVYGTARMRAIKIIENTMNGIPVKVTDPEEIDGTIKYIPNREETVAAQRKQEAIVQAFQEWIRKDKEMQNKLEEIYCDRYGYNICHYDGSFLTLPGINPEVTLHQHQKDAVARIVFCRNTLLAHDVGTGKTYEMAAGAHELKRMGISVKNLLVVPNNILAASSKAHQFLYPDDKILVIYPKDFTPGNRDEALRKIKENDYNAIYMAYSSFDKIRMSPQYYIENARKEVQKCKAEIAKACNSVVRSSLVQEYKRLQKKLEKLQEDAALDDGLGCFEELGVTGLFVDEAHNYKNISIEANADTSLRVRGKGSRKSDAMLEKVHWVQSCGSRVVFATGTPLTNSLADLYVLQKYLQPEEMDLCDIGKFPQWLNTFAEQETSFEIDVDSAGFRLKTRYTKFHNLPELMNMFSLVSDYYHAEQTQDNLPEFHGYTDIVIERSREQTGYIKYLAERTENIRSRSVNRKEDNLLKVTVDGRKCALDIRLVNPDIRHGYRNQKIQTCAERIVEIMEEYPGSSQLVFCDLSTPKEGFNVYDELKHTLTEQGMDPSRVAFIHDGNTDARREQIIEHVNRGDISVLIGSTPKLGTGVNVQKNLIAIHLLDIPWRPADVIQQLGRIVRAGNLNHEVFAYRYPTEGTFDAYLYQILENKQKFISDFLSGTLSAKHRAEEDIDQMVLNYSEVKALVIGNPLIKERVEIFNRIQHIKIAKRQKEEQMKNLKEVLSHYPEKRTAMLKRKIALTRDNEYYKALKHPVSREERRCLGANLLDALSKNIMRDTERTVGNYQGFSIILPAGMEPGTPYLMLVADDSVRHIVDMKDSLELGCCQRMDHILDHIPEMIQELSGRILRLEQETRDARADIAAGNPYEVQLKQAFEDLERIDKQLEELTKEEN